MRAGSQEARRRRNKSLVHNRKLQKVLGKGSRVQVIVIRFADPAQEAHGAGPSQFKVEHAEHKALRLENLFGGVAIVHHVDNLLH